MRWPLSALFFLTLLAVLLLGGYTLLWVYRIFEVVQDVQHRMRGLEQRDSMTSAALTRHRMRSS